MGNIEKVFSCLFCSQNSEGENGDNKPQYKNYGDISKDGQNVKNQSNIDVDEHNQVGPSQNDTITLDEANTTRGDRETKTIGNLLAIENSKNQGIKKTSASNGLDLGTLAAQFLGNSNNQADGESLNKLIGNLDGVQPGLSQLAQQFLGQSKPNAKDLQNQKQQPQPENKVNGNLDSIQPGLSQLAQQFLGGQSKLNVNYLQNGLQQLQGETQNGGSSNGGGLNLAQIAANFLGGGTKQNVQNPSWVSASDKTDTVHTQPEKLSSGQDGANFGESEDKLTGLSKSKKEALLSITKIFRPGDPDSRAADILNKNKGGKKPQSGNKLSLGSLLNKLGYNRGFKGSQTLGNFDSYIGDLVASYVGHSALNTEEGLREKTKEEIERRKANANHNPYTFWDKLKSLQKKYREEKEKMKRKVSTTKRPLLPTVGPKLDGKN